MSRHRLVNPDGLAPAVGFSYIAEPASGRTVHLAGITGHAADGSIPGDLVSQFGRACETVARLVSEAGGSPGDVISVTIYTTDLAGYRETLTEIGSAWRSVFGKHYPPMALIGVSELFDPEALVELVCVAVVPDS